MSAVESKLFGATFCRQLDLTNTIPPQNIRNCMTSHSGVKVQVQFLLPLCVI